MKTFEYFNQTLGSMWETLKVVSIAIEKDHKDHKSKTAVVKVANLVRDSLACIEGMISSIAIAQLLPQVDELMEQKKKQHEVSHEPARDSIAVKRPWSLVVQEGVVA